MKFLIIIFSIFALLFIFHLLTRKFVNPYTCFMVLGGPGSGKTTYLTKYAYKMQKKGWSIFSNVEKVGEQFNPARLGSIAFPMNSVVIIDEASLSGFDGRDWKNFDKSVNAMIKLHRKNKLIVVFSSQGVTDADKRLRDCMDYFLIVRSFARIWIIGQKISKRVIAISAKDSLGNSGIVDDYKTRGFNITFIPAWYKKFNTNSKNFGLETEKNNIKH